MMSVTRVVIGARITVDSLARASQVGQPDPHVVKSAITEFEGHAAELRAWLAEVERDA